MPIVKLSEHCSLMAKPGNAPKPAERPAERPADCPKDAAYIKSIGGGQMEIPGSAPFPIVFEGGDGDDKVVVVGSGKHGVQVYGGAGNDSMTVESEWIWLADRVGPTGLVAIGMTAAVFGALAIIIWRALSDKPARTRR